MSQEKSGEMKKLSSTASTVLEEEFDENYEPTEEEIIEYAKFLGMDVENEQEYLWIARQSLKAPLPPNWKPCQTDDGNIYYFHFITGESIWDHPCDDYYRKMYEAEKAKKKNGTAGTANEQKPPTNQTEPVTATKPVEKIVNQTQKLPSLSEISKKTADEALREFTNSGNKKSNEKLNKLVVNGKKSTEDMSMGSKPVLGSPTMKKEVDDAANELKAMKEKYDQELRGLKSRHEADIKTLRDENEMEMSITKELLYSENDTLITHFKDIYAKERKELLDKLKSDHEREVQQLKSEYAQIIETMKTQHQKEKESLLQEHELAISLQVDSQEDALQKARQEGELQLQKEKQLWASKISEGVSKNERDLKNHADKLKSDMLALTKSHETEYQAKVKEFESKFNEMTTKNKKKLSEAEHLSQQQTNSNTLLFADHAKEIETLQKKFEIEKTELLEKLASIKAENEALSKKIQVKEKEPTSYRDNEMEMQRKILVEERNKLSTLEATLQKEKEDLTKLESNLSIEKVRIEKMKLENEVILTKIKNTKSAPVDPSTSQQSLITEKDLIIKQQQNEINKLRALTIESKGHASKKFQQEDNDGLINREAKKQIDQLNELHNSFRQKLHELSRSSEEFNEKGRDGYTKLDDDHKQFRQNHQQTHSKKIEESDSTLSSTSTVSTNSLDYDHGASGQLSRQIHHEKSQLKKAREFLRKERLDIKTRQDKFENAGMKWRADLLEITNNLNEKKSYTNSYIEDKPIYQPIQSIQRIEYTPPPTKQIEYTKKASVGLLEIECELSKLLSSLKYKKEYVPTKNSIKPTRPETLSFKNIPYVMPSQTPKYNPYNTKPMGSYNTQPISTSGGLSMAKKQAWELESIRNTANLNDHQVWLREFKAKCLRS